MAEPDSLEGRIERLERHIGVDGDELAWEGYVKQYEKEVDEILEIGRGAEGFYAEFRMSKLPRYTDLTYGFGDISVKPIDKDYVCVRGYAPDDWRSGLD